MHHISVFHVHLELVSDPIAIAKSQDTLCQGVVIGIDWLFVYKNLLQGRVPLKHLLPVGGR